MIRDLQWLNSRPVTVKNTTLYLFTFLAIFFLFFIKIFVFIIFIYFLVEVLNFGNRILTTQKPEYVS